MALELSIKQESSRPTFLPRTDRVPPRRVQKPLRLSGVLMVGLGVLILGYLGITLVRGNAQKNPQDTEELKEVLGINPEGEVKDRSTFGDLLFSSDETTSEKITTEPIADPGLHVVQSELDSFGAILGLKTEKIDTQEILSEFTITVPALGIKDAKVQTGVDGTNDNIYLKVLKEAIAHFRGSALPGEAGNIFLFGHSMLPILARGTYESIFTNLPRLKKGDVIYVEYGDQDFSYQINQTAVVDPKDVFVLRQPQNQQLLTLMTCIPPGFGSDRFVAIAERI